jgi:hemerythrin
MAQLDIDALPQVAVAFMNADHREEARLLNAVTAALAALRGGQGARAEVTRRWSALVQHTRQHFAREERAMEETRFPPLEVHRAEHRLVLSAMEAEARAFDEGGDVARLARYVERAMPDWLLRHIETMDSVTARYLAACGV